VGYVADEQLPAIYSGAAAFLMPSQYEGFGFPALEAMACGTPVVTSDAGSLPELVGDAALVTPVDDLDALVAALHRIFDEPGLVQTLCTRGQAHARHFTWDATARQTVEVYRAATSQA
jgi:glycosyltransferase involved in cell wall biosynthesis